MFSCGVIFFENEPKCFTNNVPIYIATNIITIVPDGAQLRGYDKIIPATVAVTDKEIEMIIVFLNPFPIIMLVKFGITISAEMSKIPTNLIVTITATAAREMKR